MRVEFHPAGDTIIVQGAEPVRHLRVVRSGAIEIIHDGKLLDLIGEGELFGHASMLSGLPAGFEARAVEDTTCYRIDADVAHDLLADPAGMRFVARSLLEHAGELALADREQPRDPAHQPVVALMRSGWIACEPDTPIRDVAGSMTAERATCAVVRVGDGSLGILTDRDLRTRVVASGLGGDAPVSAAMSAPAYTCAPDRLGGDVLLEMLDRGFRHLPVVTGTGKLLGVVEDLDLVAAHTRSSFFLRERIAAAQTAEELVSASHELHPMVIAMHDARVAATNVIAVYSVVADTLTRRLLQLAVARLGTPGASFAWLALGSQARREALPGSDIDSALVWFGAVEDATIRAGPAGARRRRRRRPEALRPEPGPARSDRVQPGVRPLAGLLAARGAQLDRRPDPGEGAGAGLGAGRQPPRVGRAHGHARGRHVPARRAQPGAVAPARPVRVVAPPADRLPARARRRAQRRAPGTA